SFREKFNEEQIAEVRKGLPKMIDFMQKLLGSKQGELRGDALSDEQKSNMIFQCWNQVLDSPLQPNDQSVYMVVTTYSSALQHFKQMGRDADAAKLESMVEKAAEANPMIDAVIAQSMMGESMRPGMGESMRPGGAADFISCLRAMKAFLDNFDGQLGELEDIEETEEEMALFSEADVVIEALVESSPAKSVVFDPQFEAFKKGIERFKKAVKRMNETAAQPPTQSAALSQQFSPATMPYLFDNYMRSYLIRIVSSVRDIMGTGDSAMQQVMMSSGMQVVLPVVPEKDKKETKDEKKPLTPEQLERITAAEKEVYRLLDYYFEQMNEIGEPPTTSTITSAVTAQKKPTPPSLSNYKDYFDRNRTLQSYELNNLLQGQTPGSPMVIHHTMPSGQTLLGAYGFFKAADEFVKGEEKSFVKRFNTYLDKKVADGTDADKTRIELARKMFETQGATAGMMPAMITGGGRAEELNIDEKIKELEKEQKELADKGETLDFRKAFVLVLLHKQKGNMLKAVEYLDALTMTASGDIRYREQVVLKLFAALTDDPAMRKRAETAVQRLLGYQLNGNEMKDLRQTLRILNRNEEADKIRDRMLAIVTDMQTQYELLNELQNDPNKERTVQFALKIFRSPAVRNAASSSRNDYSRHVRDRALDILQKNGKLTEIVEQIEAQWKSSPGSLDIMTALADIYNKAGRKDEAKKIAKEIGEKMPDDAAKMTAYANLLQNLGMNDEAAKWTLKAIAKNPDQILQNFWQYEQNFRNSKQIPQLIAILKTVKPQRLAGQFGSFSYRVSEWRKNAETKQAAEELVQYIWAMEGVSDAERREGRANFVRSLSHNTVDLEYYSMFHEVMFDAVSPQEPKTTAAGSSVVYQSPSQSPFSVYSWSQDKCYSVSTSFFDLAEKKKILEETKKEFQKAVEGHEAIDAKKRDKNQYRNARLALAVNEIRLKNADAAVKLIEAVMKEAGGPETRYDNSGLVIAMELSTLDNNPAAVELAIKLFEEQLKSNPDASHMERVIVVPLYKLYFKTDRGEEGRALALEKLRECFKFLKLCDTNGQYQTGSRYYSSYDLQETVLTMSRILLNSGSTFDLMVIYRTMYDGQSWVKIMRERQNYRLRDIDAISKDLAGKITAKDFIEKLEQLVPSVEETADSRRQTTGGGQEIAALPMLLGHYVNSVNLAGSPSNKDLWGASATLDWFKLLSSKEKNELPLPEGSLSGIRFADALAVVAKENPERYAAVKKALEALEKTAPEEPTVLIALTSCRLIDRDHAAVESMLRHCVEWTKGEKTKGESNEQIYLGFWSILKGIFADEVLMAKPEVRADVEMLFRFVGGLTGKIVVAGTPEDRRAMTAGLSTPTQAFFLDVKRHAPEELFKKFQPDFDTRVFERFLMPNPGFLTPNLNTQRNQIAEQLSEGVVLAPRPVMQVFRNAFANGYPPPQGGGTLGRVNSMYLMFVFGRVLESARNANVEPVAVYETLRDIVLPEKNDKKPFLAEYGDLGGENGYFR
ncbi:MAG: tetratricopeptide repeat protein, partial [Planctomycetaceae bacterium]|nr:tetratricopeptide repeat protein [Planctomycetaceae bacterium]